jgi:hypothetical protein
VCVLDVDMVNLKLTSERPCRRRTSIISKNLINDSVMSIDDFKLVFESDKYVLSKV